MGKDTKKRTAPSPRLSRSTGNLQTCGSDKLKQLPPRDPCLIYEAQPSAYWSGRFMAVCDRFRSENLGDHHMDSLMEAHSDWVHRANKRSILADKQKTRHGRSTIHIPPSTTAATVLQQSDRRITDNNFARPNASELVDDDDERCKRVFQHLETLCATPEARKSLWSWQQDYARKTGQKKLMPKRRDSEQLTRTSYFARIASYKKNSKWL
ncbi:hypothetical protein BD289DRAFT_456205 [Coniella lustricola]|uniref:Uncharacterized protein n=1 Tax=Coniella lustricola TaxID=2025994 RepID=A0A2T2ZWQ3_9PEZI|nr:hypothetical protein BD289DRAFT_456205 [Coniella lustricola]